LFAPESFRTAGAFQRFAVLTGVALSAIPGAARAQHPPVVEGRVVDRVTGAPVVGARVRSDTEGLEAITGAGGAFSLRGLLPGERRIDVQAAGYRDASTRVEARNGSTTTVRLELDPDPVAVQGLQVTAAAPAGGGAIVLERADLEARGPADLAVALSEVPGLVVTRRGGPASPATVSIRGGSPDQVLVLLDGVPVHAPLTGGVDLSTITLDGVERVTVLPGVQSARYGPRALSGVILVEGRRAVADEATVRAFAGSFGTAALNGGLGGSTVTSDSTELGGRLRGEWRTAVGDFGYSVPDVRGGGQAIRLNADAETLTLGGSGSLATDRTNVRLMADLLSLDRGMPGPVVAPTPRARQEQHRVTLGGLATFMGSVTWDVALDGQRQSARFFDPGGLSSAPVDEETVARGLGGRGVARWATESLDFESGLEARTLDVSSTSLASGTPTDQRSLGVWGAGTGRTSVGGWAATLTGAVRADRHTAVSGTELSPRIGAALSRGRWNLRASVGSGFSPPSLADQFFQEGVQVRANPDLGPERVRGELELGVDVRLITSAALSLGATLDLYRADVDGMILWFPDHRFVWSPDNFDVRRRGFDAALDLFLRPRSIRVTAALSRASVTYTGPVLDGQVAYRPEWTAHTSVSSTWSAWTAELTGRYVGERRTVPGSSVNTLAPYGLADLRIGGAWSVAGWRLAPRLTIQNLFDASAAMLPDYPFPGRAWGLELTVHPDA
jgi:outer membrane cobalamin receptor